jgi:hypothetical protein
MAGRVMGKGVFVCNIPTQMSVTVVSKKVIGDDCSAADVLVTLDLDEAVITIMQKTAELQLTEGVTSMLGNVMPTECQVFNANPATWTSEQLINNGWDTQIEGQPFTPSLGADSVTGGDALATLDTSQKAIGGKMQGLVGECTAAANGTMIAGMNQLSALTSAMNGAGDIAAMQAAAASAASAHPFPNLSLGGVQQGAQQLQKFADISAKMNSLDSPLGSAMAEVKNITNDALMLSAMGKLGQAIAMKCSLPAPPEMDDAFNCLSNGIVGDSLSVLNTGMSCVSAVANLPDYSGKLDDINDLIWQGSSLGASGIATPFAAAAGFCTSVPAPAWSTSNTIRPSVRISPPERLLVSNGQASAKCTVDGSGVITGLTIKKPGQGYESTPTVTIDPPANGVAATATCTIDSSGSVNSITLTSAGSGYTAGGAFPTGTSLSDAFPIAEQAIIKGVETVKGLIEKSLGPLGDLGAAVCGAAQAGDLSAAVLPNLNVDLEALYKKANETWNDMSAEEREASRAAAVARREEAEANAP